MNSSFWQYSTLHNSPCKIIEEQNLWGNIVYRIWLPNKDTVVRVPQSALRPLTAEIQPEIEANRIAYVAAAAKVAEVLEGGSRDSDGPVLLAPMESNVIPLPHQIRVLSRAISGDRGRYLLADGEDALIVRDRDWFDKYSLSITDIAEKLNKTLPKTRAYMFELDLWDDPEMYGEKRIKSQTYKRYTQKALDAFRFAVTRYSEEEMWEKHKDKVSGRTKGS